MNKKVVLLMITLTLIISFVGYNKSYVQKDEFEIWKIKYPISYTSQQQVYRRMVFMNNIQTINRHNSDTTQTYKMGSNQFTIFTQSQFKMIFLSNKAYNLEQEKVDLYMPTSMTAIDWTEKGMVSPVKSQGNCASFYAFTAVAILQSFVLMRNKSTLFSQQQILDCSWAYQNTGCGGGDSYQSLHYVKDHGIMTQQEYPYIAKNQPCKTKKGGQFKIAGINSARGCRQMLTAIEQRPIGVTVDASNWANYRSGIFNNCNKTANYDTFLVGASDSFWKIKNSWGQTWGQQGYIRLKSGNTCGICTFQSPWAI